jgi:uncharacterized membrane protein (DUF373 family)
MLFIDIVTMIKIKYVDGIGNVLGSLLVIWILVELLETQIHHMKGGKTNPCIFVVVAMVAFIRKLLVISLKPGQTESVYFPLATILVLSLVYLIIKTTEIKLDKGK